MCITHPNIEYFIFSTFKVETQKLKNIVTNTFFFVMESGEIKSRSPFSSVQKLIHAKMKSHTLFHHPHHQQAEKVNFRAENVFLLSGTSSGE